MVFRLQDFIQLQNKSNNQYQLVKVKHFLNELQTGILLTSFSDIHFQSLVAVPLVKFTKFQKFWVGRVWVAQQLFYYEYPFYLPDLFQQKLKKDQFEIQVQVFKTFSSENIEKVFRHPTELGLSDLGSRIACPVQGDPNKFQRLNCWAITDVNIREAVIKIFEFTTFDNPRIITLERFPPNCSNQRATYFVDIVFVDIVTGNSVYFRVGGKQDGKLWSLDKFQSNEIIDMMKDPNVKKITDISDYNF